MIIIIMMMMMMGSDDYVCMHVTVNLRFQTIILTKKSALSLSHTHALK